MRKLLRKYLPDPQMIRANRWLAPFGSTLLHPRLWRLNRRSAAGAVAVGLFCGLIPGPLQMLAAALGALMFRVNLPLALLTTLYSNPLTIVPLYLAAFALGKLALGEMAGGRAFVAPPTYGEAGWSAWLAAVGDWMSGLGKPLALGLALLATLLAATGYVALRCGWRLYLLHLLHQRQRRRHSRDWRAA